MDCRECRKVLEIDEEVCMECQEKIEIDEELTTFLDNLKKTLPQCLIDFLLISVFKPFFGESL